MTKLLPIPPRSHLPATGLARTGRRKNARKNRRTPDRQTGRVQILHLSLWYDDGSTGEINMTSPNPGWGEDIETQYIYLKMYIRKMHTRLGIVAYQANICYPNPDGTVKILGTYAKVDCASLKPFKFDQFHD